MGNQLFWLATRRPSRTTLGQSSIEKGTALLGMICLGHAHRPGFETDQRDQRLLLRVGAEKRKMNRTFGKQFFGELLGSTFGSTTKGAIVQWLSRWCSTPGVSTISV